MVLATPGSGKTVMAAVVAKYLFNENMIDFVVCFAPSVAVQKSMEATFSRIIGRPMHGKIGAAGGVYTYQSLTNSKNTDWSFIKQNRVFVVFDEIHHCGGQDTELSNSWGREIMTTISRDVSYILAMTGTPWRTDQAPISLARYIEPEFSIHLDYSYGLAEAIEDNVCRKPEVILIDNNNLAVNKQNYGSLSSAMTETDLQYRQIITDIKALRYSLSSAVNKLTEVIQEQPDAGGLVVASSVDAAVRIQALLINDFGQSAVLVSYRETNPQDIIETFRTSRTRWIVSVSMISEGTDIPRLRVCLHLSTVRTELFFRQVLGRVLRLIPKIDNQRAYLFTFAEPSLILFTERLKVDVPQTIIRQDKEMGPVSMVLPLLDDNSEVNADVESAKSIGMPEVNWLTKDAETYGTHMCKSFAEFQLIGQYRERVFSIF